MCLCLFVIYRKRLSEVDVSKTYPSLHDRKDLRRKHRAKKSRQDFTEARFEHLLRAGSEGTTIVHKKICCMTWITYGKITTSLTPNCSSSIHDLLEIGCLRFNINILTCTFISILFSRKPFLPEMCLSDLDHMARYSQCRFSSVVTDSRSVSQSASGTASKSSKVLVKDSSKKPNARKVVAKDSTEFPKTDSLYIPFSHTPESVKRHLCNLKFYKHSEHKLIIL